MMKKLLCALLALTMLLGCATAFAGETYEYSAITDEVKVSKKVHLMVKVDETYQWTIPSSVDFTEPDTPADMDPIVVYGSTVPDTKLISVYLHTLNDFKLVFETNTNIETGLLNEGETAVVYENPVVNYVDYELYTPDTTSVDKVKINDITPVTKQDTSMNDVILRPVLSVTGQQGTVKEAEAANSDARVPLQSVITNIDNAEENGYYSDILSFYVEVTMAPAEDE